MFKKTISGLSIVAAAFGLAAYSAPASAHCSDPDAPGWQCLLINGTDYTDQGPQSVTYAGSSTLSHWTVGTLNCTLTADADVAVSHVFNTADLDVQSLTSSGSTSCSNVTFGNLPLVYDLGNNTDPYTKYSGSTTDTSNGTLKIYHTSGGSTPICEDNITLTYSNDGSGGSAVSFNQTISGWLGNCTISGTLTSNSSVEAW